MLSYLWHLRDALEDGAVSAFIVLALRSYCIDLQEKILSDESKTLGKHVVPFSLHNSWHWGWCEKVTQSECLWIWCHWIVSTCNGYTFKGITGWYTFKRAAPEERFYSSYNCWWKYLFFGVFTPQELWMILGTPFWGTKLAPASGSNPAQCWSPGRSSSLLCVCT